MSCEIRLCAASESNMDHLRKGKRTSLSTFAFINWMHFSSTGLCYRLLRASGLWGVIFHKFPLIIAITIFITSIIISEPYHPPKHLGHVPLQHLHTFLLCTPRRRIPCEAVGQHASRAADVKWQKLHVFIGYLSRETCGSLESIYRAFYWCLWVEWRAEDGSLGNNLRVALISPSTSIQCMFAL